MFISVYFRQGQPEHEIEKTPFEFFMVAIIPNLKSDPSEDVFNFANIKWAI